MFTLRQTASSNVKLLLEILRHIDGSRIRPWTQTARKSCQLRNIKHFHGPGWRKWNYERFVGEFNFKDLETTYLYKRCSFHFHWQLSIRIYSYIAESGSNESQIVLRFVLCETGVYRKRESLSDIWRCDTRSRMLYYRNQLLLKINNWINNKISLIV